MMKATAVICECNPLHLGHEYIFANAKKESDCVIAIMSGNFVQRAENAVFDKYARAEAVCRCGADLVIELPFPWCSASAEYFASAGVHLSGSLNADRLMFGTTGKSIKLYKAIAEKERSSAEELKSINQTEITAGAARNREKYLAQIFGEEIRDVVRSPNDILAIEYCKAIDAQKSELEIKCVPRISETDHPQFKSATLLRKIMYSESPEDIKPHVPREAYEVFYREWEKGNIASPEKLGQMEFYQLRLKNSSGKDTAESLGGVLERLQNCADKTKNAPEMFEMAATKKYTNARFRRAALYHLLQVRKEDIASKPLCTFVLAANKVGCEYLSKIRKTAGVRILTKPSDADALNEAERRQYNLLCEADRLYTMCMQDVKFSDYFLKKSPWIDKKSM